MEKERQFIKKELPTGTGRESEPKETLPAIEVANEVIWVNPDFPELPFNIKEGEPTKLGMFLTPEPREREKTFNLEVLEQHSRSGLLGRVIFRDIQGQLYRDLDLKGIGYYGPFYVAKVSIQDKVLRTAYGILDLTYAEASKINAERFTAAGIRTERYLALIRLNEIVDKNGEKISVREAIKLGILNPNQEPVIALRALGTKFRIEDAKENEKALEDAKKLVAQDLREKELSYKEYMDWFVKTAAENLGLMHKNEWCHNYLTQHNMTLDCRIVDLDSVEDMGDMAEFEKKDKMRGDYSALRGSIFNNLLRYIDQYAAIESDKNYRKELEEVFKETYIKTLGYTPEFLE